MTYFHNNIVEVLETNTFNFIDVEDSALEDASYTMSYDLSEKAWISYHDYIPDYIFSLRSKVISFFGSDILLHNSGDKCKFYKDKIYESIVSPVFKTKYKDKNIVKSFLLLNVSWISDVFKNNIQKQDKTINYISLHNSYQSTGKIELVPFKKGINSESQYGLCNIRIVKSYWNFNKFRDMVKDKEIQVFNSEALNTKEGFINNMNLLSKIGRFVDSYLKIILYIDNSNNEEVSLYDIQITSKEGF
jgi:hypothetical protein